MNFEEDMKCRTQLKTDKLGTISYSGALGKATRYFCINMEFFRSYTYQYDKRIEMVEFLGIYESQGEKKSIYFLKLHKNLLFSYRKKHDTPTFGYIETLMSEKLSWFFDTFDSNKTNSVAFKIGDFFYIKLPSNSDTREFLQYFYLSSPAHQMINKYCFYISKLNNLIKNTKFMDWLNLQIKGTRDDIKLLKKWWGFLFGKIQV